MQPTIWDTNVFINKMRKGYGWESYLNKNVILSSVVAGELATGFVYTKHKFDNFIKFINDLAAQNRILTPTHDVWYASGLLIGKMIQKRPDLKSKKSLLFNDSLIAISSNTINAMVVTANIRDFELIRNFVNFNVSYQYAS